MKRSSHRAADAKRTSWVAPRPSFRPSDASASRMPDEADKQDSPLVDDDELLEVLSRLSHAIGLAQRQPPPISVQEPLAVRQSVAAIAEQLVRQLKALNDVAADASPSASALATTIGAGNGRLAPPLRQQRIAREISKQSGVGLPARILVVDDERANRILFAKRLEHRGYQVDVASSGREALSRIRERPFDLIILDVMMPEMNGLDVLRAIRRGHDQADLPVIMATARDTSADVVEALDLGANDYITKPLDFEVVVARLKTQIGLKNARDKISDLNARLDEAHDRIAGLADKPRSSTTSAADLARSIRREISRALGNAEVVIWLFRETELRNESGGAISLPTAAELLRLKEDGRAYRASEALIAVTGQSGRLAGVVGVAPNEELFGEAEERLVTNLARHLASVLELESMRQQLAQTAQQRQTTQQDLVARGVDLLQLCPTCNRCYNQAANVCEADGSPVHPTGRPFPYRVGQRYRLVRLVGEGGMGTVFQAYDERLERAVALKLVKGEHFHNETVRVRFQKEARAVARVEHPGVIKIFDSGEAEDGSLFMVMEWLEGRDLRDLLQEQGPGTPAQVAEMLRQVSDALAAAHAEHLIHRDIKPDNIFALPGPSGLHYKVLDFGVVKETSHDSRLTETGGVVGTPLYMSPEQLMNRPVDARGDTYSLAAVAFEALTGKKTVEAEQFAEVVLAVVTNEAPRIVESMPELDPRIDHAFARGLSRLPELRPETVNGWVEEFADVLAQSPNNVSGWQLSHEMQGLEL